HTRSYGDWSSDVCSSDLGRLAVPDDAVQRGDAVGLRLRTAGGRPLPDVARLQIEPAQEAARVVRVPDDVAARDRNAARAALRVQIGRASCRERVKGSGGD